MRSIVITLTLAALGATAALAEPDHRRGPDALFERLDADGDGRLTREEIAAAPMAADADGDGAISREEAAAMAAQRAAARAGRHFDRRDANGDGVLDAAELAAMGDRRAQRLLARLDADGDGVIGREEAAAAHEGRGENRGHGHGPRDGHRRHGG